MELEVMRLLAAEARAAGRDPSSDPVPGLTRDILFASTADEEAGGLAGAAWLALEHPDTLRATAAINEAGGVAAYVGERRLYPIQVAEKGTTVYRLTIHGTWGHGSMPRADNAVGPRGRGDHAACRRRSRRASRTRRGSPRPGDRGHGRRRPFGCCARFATARNGRRTRALPGTCLPIYARALDAMLRDTLSANVVRGGVKFNVIPGEAVLEIDCRRLPGHRRAGDGGGDPRSARAGARRRHATSSWSSSPTPSSPTIGMPPGLYPILEAVIREHDPEGVPLPAMAPVLDRREAPARARRLDVRLLADAPATGRDVPRAVARRRRARVARGPPLGPAGPVRCRPAVLRGRLKPFAPGVPQEGRNPLMP